MRCCNRFFQLIGGNRTNTDAAYLAEYFNRKGVKTNVVGVPCTISGGMKNNFVVSAHESVDVARESLLKCFAFARVVANAAFFVHLSICSCWRIQRPVVLNVAQHELLELSSSGILRR